MALIGDIARISMLSSDVNHDVSHLAFRALEWNQISNTTSVIGSEGIDYHIDHYWNDHNSKASSGRQSWVSDGYLSRLRSFRSKQYLVWVKQS